MRRTPFIAALALPLLFGLVATSVDAQWRYPPVYYPGGYGYEPEASLKFSIKPKDASIYVDGYFAGKVADYDGAFKRLHVSSGRHAIVVYLPGYRSLKQQLYLSPDKTRKIEGELERLSPGESDEPVPQPTQGPDTRDTSRMPPRGPMTRRVPPPPPPDQPPTRAPAPPPGTENTRFGTLSIRIQPNGATVLIDGERWTGPNDPNERLIVQVPDGHHTIDVTRDGYERFVTEIDVRRGETVPVNVSLTRTR